MDMQDVPNTPEWRPTSSLSGGTTSLAASSNLRHSHISAFSPFEQYPDLSSSGYSSLAPVINFGTNDVSRNISPYETTACERLIEDLRPHLHPSIEGDGDDVSFDSSLRQSETLDALLHRAVVIIKYNAKWFLLPALSTFLTSALTAASTSSSSGVLQTCLELIDTIATFSQLPPNAPLLASVRFIAQTYYNASRANKTKKVAEKAWRTFERLLHSHLGEQCLESLLQVVGGIGADSGNKSDYAQVTGAVMLITDHLLTGHGDGDGQLPKLSIAETLPHLKHSATHGDDFVREHVMTLLGDFIQDTALVEELSVTAQLEALIDTIEACVSPAPRSQDARSVVERLQHRVSIIEPRHLIKVAMLVIAAGLPLRSELHDSLITSWQGVLPQAEWTDEFETTLRKICASSLYLPEVAFLVTRSLDIFLACENEVALRVILSGYRRRISSSMTNAQAAAIIGQSHVNTFERCMTAQVPYWRRALLFEGLCNLADRSPDVAILLFRLRFDVTGAMYFRPPYSEESTTPDHASTEEESGVFHDAWRLPAEKWHQAIPQVVADGALNWKTYECYLTGVPPALSNHEQFQDTDFIRRLLSTVIDRFKRGMIEPPVASGSTKTYVLAQHILILTALASYYRVLNRNEMLEIITLFITTAGTGDATVSKYCIHALTICCYEVPGLITKYMDEVIDKMSRMVTQRYLGIHVLQFIVGLSRLPDLYANFTVADYKKIFGVCHSYLQATRGSASETTRNATPMSETNPASRKEDALPGYVYALAHHVIFFWYICLKPQDRAALKPFIKGCLTYKGADGKDYVEDQGIVTIDMMDRVDAGMPDPMQLLQESPFDATDGRLVESHRLTGLVLVSTQTALRTGRSLITVRRPSGTAQRLVEKGVTTITVDAGEDDVLPIVPSDEGGKLYGAFTIPRSSSILGAEEILTMEDSDAFKRALQSFDRTSGLDAHKAGVIYIGEAQLTDQRILQNISGSPDYREFLKGLGSVRLLKGAPFNTQGLDRADGMDGKHAIVWKNEFAELVYHVTTMMPNQPDPNLNTASKKRHIGNDHVNIVFNNSGVSFNWFTLYNMFPGQLTFVYIVVTPSARTSFVEARSVNSATPLRDRFYRVEVVTHPDYPNSSSAAEAKVVSGASLPGYVRNLALSDCIISLMWSPINPSSEYPSQWRFRMGQLKTMGQRFGKA